MSAKNPDEADVFIGWSGYARLHGRSMIKKQCRKRERQWISRLLAKDYGEF